MPDRRLPAPLSSCLALVLALAGCGGQAQYTPLGADGGGGAPDGGTPQGGGATCSLTSSTTPKSTVTAGCALLDRDTSACRASRTAQGLSGAWLRFSCRVTLQKTQANGRDVVVLSADSRPDYKSNYFPASDACYAPFTTASPDPNQIAAQSLSITAPLTPNTTTQAMSLGPVGVALNGVAIFDNQAAPGDDIYAESGSFDQCQGHPARGGFYHYHSEPYSISADDSALVGILRDGYLLYGRRDASGAVPSLDAAGGHIGPTPDSATPVYHHHVNLQTSGSGANAGKSVWFLTTGQYAGTPG